jgi:hypothetical protein
LGDQQQVAPLHRELVEQHQVAVAKALHFQPLIPGQEGIGPGATAMQVLGGA